MRLMTARMESLVSPTGSIGYRWGEKGKWNIDQIDGRYWYRNLELGLINERCTADEIVEVSFPYFGGQKSTNLVILNIQDHS